MNQPSGDVESRETSDGAWGRGSAGEHPSRHSQGGRWVRHAAYALAVLVAIAIPPYLSVLQLPNIAVTHTELQQPFVLFGLTGSIALLCLAALEIRRQSRPSLRSVAPTLVLLLIGFHYLMYLAAHSNRSGDYICYEKAGAALLADQDPYSYAEGYIYPPLPAQAFAVALNAAQAVSPFSSAEAGPLLIFYVYQCVQLLLLLTAYALMVELVRRLQVPRLPASLLVGALFLCSTPLLRTVMYNQVNLWILDIMLSAGLYASSHPLVSGAAAALGAHAKLYPAILIFPWTVMRRFMVIAGFVGGGALILALQAILPGGLGLWASFLRFFRAFPSHQLPRDNSLHNVAASIERVALLLGIPQSTAAVLTTVALAAMTLGVVGWYLARSLERERSWRTAATVEGRVPALDARRTIGHLCDAMGFMLLLSPVAWEHHFILAMPLAALAVVDHGDRRPWLVGGALLLVFAIPTYDVWPLSYNRLAGLLILLTVCTPKVETRSHWLSADREIGEQCE